MNLLNVLDRLMGTTHIARPHPTTTRPSSDLTEARRQVVELQHDIEWLDIALSVAETRLRSRGLQWKEPSMTTHTHINKDKPKDKPKDDPESHFAEPS